MNLNKKKLLKIAAFSLTSAFCLSGCGVVEMTESQEKVIAEYAANVLIHYDASYYEMFAEEPKIKDETQEAVADANTAEPAETAVPETPTVEPEATPAATPEPTQNPEEMTGEAVTGNVVQQSTTPLDVGKLFGLDKIEISYKNLTIVDKYPEASDGQPAFQVNASDNHKLIVLSFDIVNTDDIASACDILDQNVKFRVCVNNSDYLSVQKTLLNEDLSQINTTLQPHENKTAVVVCEVPADYNPEITSLSLIVRTGGEDKTVVLK